MAGARLTVAQEVLNERPMKKKLLSMWALQGLIFAFFYAAVELVTTTFLQVILFPLATGISIYNSHRAIRSYRYEKNKSLGKKVGLALNLLSTLLEMIAVTGAVAAYSQMTWNVGFEFLPQVAALFGLKLITFQIVPAIFVGILGINCLAHAAKAVIHGVKMAYTAYKHEGTYSSKYAHHKAEFLLNLRMAIVFGVSAAAVGLLLLTPAFHLTALAAGVVLGAKVIAASIAGSNSLWNWRGVYSMRQAEKKQEKESPSSSISQRSSLSPKAASEEKPVVIHIEQQKKIDNFYKAAAEFDDHIEDLKRKMDAAAEEQDKAAPQKLLVEFLDKEANSLRASLKMPAPVPSTAQSNESEEREQEVVTKQNAPGAPTFFGRDLQAQTRRDKLQALVWLRALIMSEQNKVVIREDRVHAEQKELLKTKELNGLKELTDYIRDRKMEENVYSSILNNKGRMQKVFALADHYLSNLGKYSPYRSVSSNVSCNTGSVRTVDLATPGPHHRRASTADFLSPSGDSAALPASPPAPHRLAY